MPQHVVNGATMMCSFGVAPSSLIVLPDKQVLSSYMPAANIMDNKPMVNIPPFGMCFSLANPAVAAATSAAMGVLTPQPCIPVTSAPWTPGAATVLVKNIPALDNTSMCTCNWAGVISIASPGQATELIP